MDNTRGHSRQLPLIYLEGPLFISLLIITSLTGAHVTNAETYSSTARLELLVAAQEILIKHVEDFVLLHEDRLAVLRSTLERLKNSTIPRANDGTLCSESHGSNVITGHPINAHHIVTGWAEISHHATQIQYSPLNDVTTQIEDTLGVSLPTPIDVEGSTDALLRLQETYDLTTRDMSMGLVGGVRSQRSLSQHNHLLLGRLALKEGSVDRAAEWLEIAFHEFTWSADQQTAILADIVKAYHVMAKYSETITLLEQTHHRGLVINDELQQRLEVARKLNSSSSSKQSKRMWHRYLEQRTRAYRELCRGESSVHSHDKPVHRQVECRLQSGLIPYIVYKQEILCWDPFIVQYYDVISRNEARFLQLSSMPTLRRAQVGHVGDSIFTPVVSSSRVGQVAWLEDGENQLLARLSNRVSDITGLRTSPFNGNITAEPFQVLNYGIGGQYEPHCDYIKGEDNRELQVRALGNRLATFMFYLSDVKAGGATVFPELGIRIEPIKQSAAFWYNMKADGSTDARTEHAGCPVLLGHKWVANKWIRQRGQTKHNTCLLGAR